MDFALTDENEKYDLESFLRATDTDGILWLCNEEKFSMSFTPTA